MLRAQESRNVLSALIGVDRRPTKSIRRTPASCTAVERSCPRPGSVRLLPSSDLENCTRPHPDPAPKPNFPRARAVEPFELAAASQLTIRVHAAHPLTPPDPPPSTPPSPFPPTYSPPSTPAPPPAPDHRASRSSLHISPGRRPSSPPACPPTPAPASLPPSAPTRSVTRPPVTSPVTR